MESSKVLASVIILSYNSAETLPQAIESVLSQQCNFPFEIVIGEDCSTDASRDICIKYAKKYPDKIRLILNESNMGMVKNWINLIKESRGKYIAGCAGDDYWSHTLKLQLQVNYLEARPDYGIVYTDVDMLDPRNGKTIKNRIKASGKTIYEGGGLTKVIYSGKVPIVALTVCFRRDLFIKYIPTEDYINLKFPIEDWPTWLILSKYCKIGYLPVSTATYRRGHESASNPLQYEKIEKRFKAEQVMYKYVSDMFPRDLDYSEINYQNYIDTVLLNLAYKKRDYISAKKFAAKLIGNHFSSRQVKMTGNLLFFIFFILLQKVRKLLTR